MLLRQPRIVKHFATGKCGTAFVIATALTRMNPLALLV